MRPEIQRVMDLCEVSMTTPQEDTSMNIMETASVCSVLDNECLPEEIRLAIQETEKQFKSGQLDTTQVAKFKWMYDDFKARVTKGHRYDKYESTMKKFEKLNKQIPSTEMILNMNVLATYIVQNDGRITYDCIYRDHFHNKIVGKNKKKCLPLLNHLRQDHPELLEIQVPKNILFTALACVKKCLMSGNNFKLIDDTNDHHRDDCQFYGNKISVRGGQESTSVRERTTEVTTEELKRLEEDKENRLIDSLSRRGNSLARKNKMQNLQATQNPITAVTADAPVLTTMATNGMFERPDQTRTAAVVSSRPAAINPKKCSPPVVSNSVALAEKRTVANYEDILKKLPPSVTVTHFGTRGTTNNAQVKQGPSGRPAAPVIISTAGPAKNLSSCVSITPVATANTADPKNRSLTKVKQHVSKATSVLHRENAPSGFKNDRNKQCQTRQKPAQVIYESSARPSTSTDMENNELRTFVNTPSKNGSNHAQGNASCADKQRSNKRKIADVTEAIDLSVPNKRKKDSLVNNDVSRLVNEYTKKILTTNLQTASAQHLSKVRDVMQEHKEKQITTAQARQQSLQLGFDFNKLQMFMADAVFYLESVTCPRSYAKKMGLQDNNAKVLCTRLMRITPSEEVVKILQQMSVHFAKLITHFTVIEGTKRGRKTVTKEDLIETLAMLDTSACLDIENVERRADLYSLSRCYELQKFLWPATRLLRHVKSYYFDNMQRPATTVRGILSNCCYHKDSMLQCLLRTSFTPSFISELQLIILRFQIMTCFAIKDLLENDLGKRPKVLEADIFDFLNETSFDLHDAPNLALLAYRKRNDKQIKNYFTELK